LTLPATRGDAFSPASKAVVKESSLKEHEITVRPGDRVRTVKEEVFLANPRVRSLLKGCD
jgi:hypothetical protein